MFPLFAITLELSDVFDLNEEENSYCSSSDCVGSVSVSLSLDQAYILCDRDFLNRQDRRMSAGGEVKRREISKRKNEKECIEEFTDPYGWYAFLAGT